MTRIAGFVLALFVTAAIVGCGGGDKSEAPEKFAPVPKSGPEGASAGGAGKKKDSGLQAPEMAP